MWSPTHIQVTVNRAKKLLTKGKNGTNNCFVTIALGKEKYQTSVKEKSPENVDWHEECELAIPERGNRAELVLTCLHRNNLSIDEFLGQITLPLQEMDIYEQPRSKWYTLESKPGKEKKKDRGQLEIRILFTVKAGSLNDLSKKEKHKSSFGQLASSVGGSLLSIGTLEKRKGIKKFAKSLGSKMHISGKSKKNKDGGGADSDSFSGSFASIGTPNSSVGTPRRFGGQQYSGDADPGVISEDEDEFVFDNLSHKSSGSSLNINKSVQPRNQQQQPRIPSPLLSKEDVNLRSRTLPIVPSRNPSDPKLDEWQQKLYGKHLDVGSTDSLKRRSWNVPLANTKEESEDFINQEILLHSEQLQNEQVKKQNVVKEEPEELKPVVREQPPPTLPKTTPPTLPIVKSNENLHEIQKNDQITEKVSPKPPVKPNPLPRAATAGNLLNDSSTPKTNLKKSEKQKDDKKQRFSKLINFRKESNDIPEDGNRRFGERINPVGHENNFIKPYSPVPELSQELLNKYDGKTREEVIVIAHGLETEVLVQRNRVKELEDYLDNLLLRVMETHPKILQNPYRTTSIKSG